MGEFTDSFNIASLDSCWHLPSVPEIIHNISVMETSIMYHFQKTTVAMPKQNLDADSSQLLLTLTLTKTFDFHLHTHLYLDKMITEVCFK